MSSSMGSSNLPEFEPPDRLQQGPGGVERPSKSRESSESSSVDEKAGTVSRQPLHKESQEAQPIKPSRIKEILRGATPSNMMRKVGNVINKITSPLARINAPDSTDSVTVMNVVEAKSKLIKAVAKFEAQKQSGENTTAARNELQQAKTALREAETKLAGYARTENKNFKELLKSTEQLAKAESELNIVLEKVQDAAEGGSTKEYLKNARLKLIKEPNVDSYQRNHLERYVTARMKQEAATLELKSKHEKLSEGERYKLSVLTAALNKGDISQYAEDYVEDFDDFATSQNPPTQVHEQVESSTASSSVSGSENEAEEESDTSFDDDHGFTDIDLGDEPQGTLSPSTDLEGFDDSSDGTTRTLSFEEPMRVPTSEARTRVPSVNLDEPYADAVNVKDLEKRFADAAHRFVNFGVEDLATGPVTVADLKMHIGEKAKYWESGEFNEEEIPVLSEFLNASKELVRFQLEREVKLYPHKEELIERYNDFMRAYDATDSENFDAMLKFLAKPENEWALKVDVPKEPPKSAMRKGGEKKPDVRFEEKTAIVSGEGTKETGRASSLRESVALFDKAVRAEQEGGGKPLENALKEMTLDQKKTFILMSEEQKTAYLQMEKTHERMLFLDMSFGERIVYLALPPDQKEVYVLLHAREHQMYAKSRQRQAFLMMSPEEREFYRTSPGILKINLSMLPEEVKKMVNLNLQVTVRTVFLDMQPEERAAIMKMDLQQQAEVLESKVPVFLCSLYMWENTAELTAWLKASEDLENATTDGDIVTQVKKVIQKEETLNEVENKLERLIAKMSEQDLEDSRPELASPLNDRLENLKYLLESGIKRAGGDPAKIEAAKAIYQPAIDQCLNQLAIITGKVPASMTVETGSEGILASLRNIKDKLNDLIEIHKGLISENYGDKYNKIQEQIKNVLKDVESSPIEMLHELQAVYNRVVAEADSKNLWRGNKEALRLAKEIKSDIRQAEPAAKAEETVFRTQQELPQSEGRVLSLSKRLDESIAIADNQEKLDGLMQKKRIYERLISERELPSSAGISEERMTEAKTNLSDLKDKIEGKEISPQEAMTDVALCKQILNDLIDEFYKAKMQEVSAEKKLLQSRMDQLVAQGENALIWDKLEVEDKLNKCIQKDRILVKEKALEKARVVLHVIDIEASDEYLELSGNLPSEAKRSEAAMKHETAKGKLEGAKQTIAELEEELVKLQGKVAEVANAPDLFEQADQLLSDLRIMGRDTSELEEQLAGYNYEIENLESQVKEMDEEIAELKKGVLTEEHFEKMEAATDKHLELATELEKKRTELKTVMQPLLEEVAGVKGEERQQIVYNQAKDVVDAILEGSADIVPDKENAQLLEELRGQLDEARKRELQVYEKVKPLQMEGHQLEAKFANANGAMASRLTAIDERLEQIETLLNRDLKRELRAMLEIEKLALSSESEKIQTKAESLAHWHEYHQLSNEKMIAYYESHPTATAAEAKRYVADALLPMHSDTFEKTKVLTTKVKEFEIETLHQTVEFQKACLSLLEATASSDDFEAVRELVSQARESLFDELNKSSFSVHVDDPGSVYKKQLATVRELNKKIESLLDENKSVKIAHLIEKRKMLQQELYNPADDVELATIATLADNIAYIDGQIKLLRQQDAGFARELDSIFMADGKSLVLRGDEKLSMLLGEMAREPSVSSKRRRHMAFIEARGKINTIPAAKAAIAFSEKHSKGAVVSQYGGDNSAELEVSLAKTLAKAERRAEPTQFQLLSGDTVDNLNTLQGNLRAGRKAAAVNCANDTVYGSVWRWGGSQEEQVFRKSNLSTLASQFKELREGKSHHVPVLGAMYVKGATFMDPSDMSTAPADRKSFKGDIVFVAALDLSADYVVKEVRAAAAEAGIPYDDFVKYITKMKYAAALGSMLENGVTDVLMSLPGTGSFANPLPMIQDILKELLFDAGAPFKDKFATVNFNVFGDAKTARPGEQAVAVMLKDELGVPADSYDYGKVEQQVKAVAAKHSAMVANIAQHPKKVVAFYYSPLTNVDDVANSNPTGFLGNFAACKCDVFGQKFRCVEAAFQWKKYDLASQPRDDDSREMAAKREKLRNDPRMQQMITATGDEAFKLKRELDKDYNGVYAERWLEGGRDEVMFEALKAKFEQNPEFRDMLMATGDAYLLEHNETIGRDDYWSDNKNGTGHNMLGKMLMAIRGGQDKPRSEPQGPLLPQDNESVWQNYKAFNEQQEGKRAIPYSIFERGRK